MGAGVEDGEGGAGGEPAGEHRALVDAVGAQQGTDQRVDEGGIGAVRAVLKTNLRALILRHDDDVPGPSPLGREVRLRAEVGRVVAVSIEQEDQRGRPVLAVRQGHGQGIGARHRAQVEAECPGVARGHGDRRRSVAADRSGQPGRPDGRHGRGGSGCADRRGRRRRVHGERQRQQPRHRKENPQGPPAPVLAQGRGGRITRQPLCPPKPNEFDRTAVGSHGRGSPCTRFNEISGSCCS